MFSGYKRIELGIINRKISGKSSDIWKLKQCTAKEPMEQKKTIKREIQNILNENENTSKVLGCS